MAEWETFCEGAHWTCTCESSCTYVPHYDEQETTRAFAKQEREKSLITVTASTG